MSKIKELLDDVRYTEIDFNDDVEYQEYLEDIYRKSLQDMNQQFEEENKKDSKN